VAGNLEQEYDSSLSYEEDEVFQASNRNNASQQQQQRHSHQGSRRSQTRHQQVIHIFLTNLCIFNSPNPQHRDA
jgi:hypothetical protein